MSVKWDDYWEITTKDWGVRKEDKRFTIKAFKQKRKNWNPEIIVARRDRCLLKIIIDINATRKWE